jgi:hypothetical protein
LIKVTVMVMVMVTVMIMSSVSPRADLMVINCMKNRRKSPNLPQNEGAPPLFKGALSK